MRERERPLHAPPDRSLPVQLLFQLLFHFQVHSTTTTVVRVNIVEPDITVRTSHFHFLFVVVGASAITNPANDEDSSTNGGSWNQGDSPAAAFAARGVAATEAAITPKSSRRPDSACIAVVAVLPVIFRTK